MNNSTSRIEFWFRILRRIGLQGRFLIITSLLVILVAGLSGLYLYKSVTEKEYEALNSRAHITAKLLAEAFSQPLWNLDDQTIQSYLDAMLLDKEIHQVAIFGPLDPTPLFIKSRHDRLAVDPIITQEEIIYRSRQESLGWVEVSFTQEYLVRSSLQLQRILGGTILLLVIALVVGLSLMLRTMVIRPLHEMTGVMDQISEGNCNVNIHTRSNDEVGSLADAFRRMGHYLRRMAAAANRIAKQDFGDILQPTSEKDALGTAFQTMIVNLRAMMNDVQTSQQKLEAINHDLQAFNYSVSHDLQAPIRIIDGYSRILLEDYGQNIPADGQKYLTRIIEASVKMNDLINGLLALSRVGQASIKITPIDSSAMDRMVQEIITELAASSPQRQIGWRIDRLRSCRADPVLLRQVWVNLIQNAYKYTGAKENGTIEIGNLDTPEGVGYYIRDNGAGFDMKYYDKLFKEFQRLHSEGNFTGSGVGLATVKRIIDIHGGRIWAEALEEQGATFYFVLPR